MTLEQSDISELLDAIRAGGGIDVVRRGVELVLQALIAAEASEFIGAQPFERSATRTNLRNGTRERLPSTKAGDVQLQIPKVRKGSFFPAVLERRRRIDRALFAVVMEAYVHGVSTRKVDDLVQALGLQSGISKSEVSRICAELDESLDVFRQRSLGHVAFPYVFLDATYLKGRAGGAVTARAVVVATGVTLGGEREVLGLAVGDSEDGAFWTEFLRSLRARGLAGMRLVISDAHLGLQQAIATVMLGAAWQRCRVHFVRNVLARVPRGSAEMVAAAIRTIFAQPDAAAVSEQFERIAEMLGRQFPDVATMLHDARHDLLAFSAFPVAHWRKVWSTNPIERLHREIKRRTDVVGVFPNDAAIDRLVTAVVLEQHEEWQVAERRYLSDGSMAELTATLEPDPPPARTRRRLAS
ncbi:MAG: IS256 family transposase [Chloroflexi bacterium]|nr:IS256 family transposase [Chloroflexota bacterium]